MHLISLVVHLRSINDYDLEYIIIDLYRLCLSNNVFECVVYYFPVKPDVMLLSGGMTFYWESLNKVIYIYSKSKELIFLKNLQMIRKKFHSYDAYILKEC